MWILFSFFYVGEFWDSSCWTGALQFPNSGRNLHWPQEFLSALRPAKEQKSLIKKIEALRNHWLNTEEFQEAWKGRSK